jgi:hypothetical protein
MNAKPAPSLSRLIRPRITVGNSALGDFFDYFSYDDASWGATGGRAFPWHLGKFDYSLR